MHGKTKSFFEDTIVVIIIAGLAYGAYEAYNVNFNTDDSQRNENNTTVTKDNKNTLNEIALFVDDIINDLKPKVVIEKTSDDLESKNSIAINELIVEEKEKNKILIEEPINETVSDIVEKIETENIKTESIKEKSVIEEVKISIKDELPKDKVVEEKKVDLAVLNKFKKDLKFNIATNLVKSDDLDTTQTNELKIRITVLKDGGYEDLTFIDGDKTFFEINKENIVKIFPVYVDDSIKEDFPRYIRLSIK